MPATQYSGTLTLTRTWTMRCAMALTLALCSACAGDAKVDAPAPPAAVELVRLAPTVLLPNTVVLVEGGAFGSGATHTLVLSGKSAKGEINTVLPLKLSSEHENRAELTLSADLFASIGEGDFEGTAYVASQNDFGRNQGAPLSVKLRLETYLTPKLSAVGDGIVYLNTPVALDGGEILLGEGEGQTRAELKGCFLPKGTSGDCATNGRQVETTLDVTSEQGKADLATRRYGRFAFAPKIAGILPGRFSGMLTLANEHRDGVVTRSQPKMVTFDLLRSKMTGFEQVEVSYGQLLSIRGKGFIGGNGVTSVRFVGEFESDKGDKRPVTFDIIGGFKSGELIQTALEESGGVGAQIRLRSETGTLRGKWTPTLRFGQETIEADAIVLGLKISRIKQVVWVNFTSSFVSSLRRFGLRAADERIRRRVIAILERDYEGINLDFRLTRPDDYQLYARVDINGKDPNGMGLLGYDNTPGKDIDNERLHDRIGGVNALTQEDGYPGYGGIFADSMLGFSMHPPAGVSKSPLADKRFDEIFDPVRPDLGSEVTSAEALSVPEVSDPGACPAKDRTGQVACAIRVLANLVGHTTSHELGHSLGLADPYGSETTFHNLGDAPRRLMDGGADRPFGERAELDGEGPAVFCFDAYQYLRAILPSAAPAASVQDRPSCF